MSDSLPLLDKPIAPDEAPEGEGLSHLEKEQDFFSYLLQHRTEIRTIVAFHLGVFKDCCRVEEEFKEWVLGSFNVCIPVYIDNSAKNPKKVFIKFPLPYEVGESQYPGNAVEKLRSEAATHIWMQRNCPGLPIPCLRGFGFPGGQAFTAPQNTPFSVRIAWFFRRVALWLFRLPVPCRYVSRQLPCKLEASYLIVDCVENGKKLSESWEEFRYNRDRSTNLFRDLSRAILSMSRIPFPRIGSLTIDNRGLVSLTNRPLNSSFQQLQNPCIPMDILRNRTYSTAEPYFSDLVACHDNRVLRQDIPDSMRKRLNSHDRQGYPSAVIMMKCLSGRFAMRDLRYGPFVLMFTDLQPSDIFVDSNWNVTSIVDFEWVCARPIEMLHPPYWVINCSFDDFKHANREVYSPPHAEFSGEFATAEEILKGGDTPYADIMGMGYRLGLHWFVAALDGPDTLYDIYVEAHKIWRGR